MPAVDLFANAVPTLDSPGLHAETITPDDDTDLENATRAIWVGTAGHITIDVVGGESNVQFKNVPVGMFSMRATRVYAAGTTASDLVAVW